MKHIFISCLVYCFAIIASGQTGSITVFSADKDPFFLYLNGEQRNMRPDTEVKVSGLNQSFYQVKLVFANQSFPAISKSNLAVSDGEDNLMDAMYKVTRSGNTHRIKFYSINPPKGTAVDKDDKAIVATDVKVTEDQATGSIQVFSEAGDNFFLYLNGVQMNTVAQSSVRVEGLTELYYQVRVVYADRKFSAISKNTVSVSDGDDVLMDATYKITRSDQSSKLRFYAMNPTGRRRLSIPGTVVYRWQEPGKAIADAKPQLEKPVVKSETAAKPVVEASSKPAVKEELPAKPLAKEPAKDKPALAKNDNKQKAEPAKQPVKPQVKDQPKAGAPAAKVNPVISEPEDWACANEWPVWKTEFSDAKKNMEQAKTDKDKLAIAQKLVSNNCVNTDQVIELASLIGKEELRLELVRKAFSRTIDYRNYHRALNLFQKDASKQAFRAMIKW
ncbi:MAG TPA: hypothetical protein DHV17_06985 [Chitinophagaceae bacterium]|nr:hypothetical protein [Chitinophagaceae bacterium]